MCLGLRRRTLHLESAIVRQDGDNLVAVGAVVVSIVGPLGDVGDDGADEAAKDTAQEGCDAVVIISGCTPSATFRRPNLQKRAKKKKKKKKKKGKEKITPFGRSFPGRRG